MNLIEAVVTKVLSKNTKTLKTGDVVGVATVEYTDMGGTGTNRLYVKLENLEDIDIGYKFQH